MKHLYHIPAIFLSSMIVFFLFLSGCKEKPITCRWRGHEITIDGRDTEWGNFIQHYNGKYNVVLCMYNDENDLYMKVSTPDQMLQQQFLMFGFTVWFDSGGGKNKTLGIRFPIGMQAIRQNEQQSGPPGDQQSDPPVEPRAGRRNNRSADIAAREKALKGELYILGPGSDECWKFSPESAKEQGIQADFGTTSGILVYELRIPLRKSEKNYYAIGADPNVPIGIGFETGTIRKEELKKNDRDRETVKPSDLSSGGTIRRNRSRSERSGAMRGMQRMSEPAEFWVKASLAPKP